MRLLVGGAVALVTQIGALVVLWEISVRIARSIGRFPPDIFFEITFGSGVALFSLFALIATFTALRLRTIGESLMVVGALVFAWILWLLPSLSGRPIALPIFIIIGVSVLATVSGVIMPLWSRAEYQRNQLQKIAAEQAPRDGIDQNSAEQAVSPKSDRASG